MVSISSVQWKRIEDKKTYLGRNTAHRLLRRKKQFPKSVHECGGTVLVHKPYEGDLHLLRIGSLTPPPTNPSSAKVRYRQRQKEEY